MTHDEAEAGAVPHAAAGLGLALVSAFAFALSGALARPMLDSGWSAGAIVLIRIALGALVVLPFGLRAVHGRWHLVRRAAPTILVYGMLAVAGAQFFYFSSLQYLQVGPALLIEYTAPAAVVLWMWLTRGQRPGRLTVVGALVCAIGLFLVLDLVTGVGLDPVGVLWALGAMTGATAYFVISGDDRSELPSITLAAGGLVVGAAVLGLLGLVGALPMEAATGSQAYAGVDVAWWVPLVLLGVVTAATAYVTGVAAIRLLGSRLASFVALSEVVAGVLWSWALLSELPGAIQLIGGLLILVGVAGVKLGERDVAVRPESAAV